MVLTNYDFSLANEVQVCPFTHNDSAAMKNPVDELDAIDASSIQKIQDANNDEESLGFVANAIGPAKPIDNFTLVEDFIRAQLRKSQRRRPKQTCVKNHRTSKKSFKMWRRLGIRVKNIASLSSSEKQKKYLKAETANNYP